MIVPREALSVCNGGASVVTTTLSVTLPTCSCVHAGANVDLDLHVLLSEVLEPRHLDFNPVQSPRLGSGTRNVPALLVCDRAGLVGAQIVQLHRGSRDCGPAGVSNGSQNGSESDLSTGTGATGKHDGDTESTAISSVDEASPTAAGASQSRRRYLGLAGEQRWRRTSTN